MLVRPEVIDSPRQRAVGSNFPPPSPFLSFPILPCGMFLGVSEDSEIGDCGHRVLQSSLQYIPTRLLLFCSQDHMYKMYSLVVRARLV
jgi:hypothetical protein